MPLYECVLIARQDLSMQQADALIKNCKTVIEEQEGTVGKTEYWGLRQLAYRIRKNRKGHYALLNIDAPASAIHELERRLRLNEDVLRHLVIKVDALESEPSVMMQRANRDERRLRPAAAAPKEAQEQVQEEVQETVASEEEE